MRREVADRYVPASEVVAVVNPIGLPAQVNEAQARELAPLLDEPEALREAWAEARERAEREQRPLTAALVAEAVAARRPAGTGDATRASKRLATAVENLAHGPLGELESYVRESEFAAARLVWSRAARLSRSRREASRGGIFAGRYNTQAAISAWSDTSGPDAGWRLRIRPRATSNAR